MYTNLRALFSDACAAAADQGHRADLWFADDDNKAVDNVRREGIKQESSFKGLRWVTRKSAALHF
jgi:hypothetical protein